MQTEHNKLDLTNRSMDGVRPSQGGKKGSSYSKVLVSKLRKLLKNKTVVKRIVVVVLIVGALLFVNSYINTRDALKKASDPGATVQEEATKLAAKIGKFLELPTGETPSVATVKNADQLKTQSFFESAQNGDKVLIYPQAQKAVLYRPSTSKVIEYSPVSSNPGQ